MHGKFALALSLWLSGSTQDACLSEGGCHCWLISAAGSISDSCARTKTHVFAENPKQHRTCIKSVTRDSHQVHMHGNMAYQPWRRLICFHEDGAQPTPVSIISRPFVYALTVHIGISLNVGVLCECHALDEAHVVGE